MVSPLLGKDVIGATTVATAQLQTIAHVLKAGQVTIV